MADGRDGPSYSESHDNNFSGATSKRSGDGCIDGQDNLLPVAVIGRIMKQALPPHAKISKEAKETMQECASEFIGFVTGEASSRCREEKRKTINGNDICIAFKTLGLDVYADAMRKYLDKYREHGEKSTSVKHGKSFPIDIRDKLSVSRSDPSRKSNVGFNFQLKQDG